MKTISILIPCHNEENNLHYLFEALCDLTLKEAEIHPEGADTPIIISMKDYNWKFMFVNDGSSDDTLTILRELANKDERITIINLSRNFGKENAMLAGMDLIEGNAVIIMDADLQHPVETIPEMVYWWSKGYDDVYGRRLVRGKESVLRRNMSMVFYKTLDSIADINTLPNVGDFRLLDRKVIDALRSLRETQRYTKGLYCWVGFSKKGVEFCQAERTGGKSSFNFFRLLNLAIDGITDFSTKPLRMASIAGGIVSFLAFTYMIFIIVKTIIWGEPVTGFPTLICVILLLGGLQLLALGVIGEYLGRIFNEVKNRPPYIIESIIKKETES
ncbi:MAG: glycosyltransferase family 2 protein [Muribaculaceae bacterium]|nr:glycosyltransferase family 2 protein [Muribaculaceae bacterium]